jgi:hypothetical protein
MRVNEPNINDEVNDFVNLLSAACLSVNDKWHLTLIQMNSIFLHHENKPAHLIVAGITIIFLPVSFHRHVIVHLHRDMSAMRLVIVGNNDHVLRDSSQCTNKCCQWVTYCINIIVWRGFETLNLKFRLVLLLERHVCRFDVSLKIRPLFLFHGLWDRQPWFWEKQIFFFLIFSNFIIFLILLMIFKLLSSVCTVLSYKCYLVVISYT